MPAPIFISYRSSDTAGHAGRLPDRLLHWGDKSEFFFDICAVEAGEAFPEALEQTVDAARLMLKESAAALAAMLAARHSNERD